MPRLCSTLQGMDLEAIDLLFAFLNLDRSRRGKQGFALYSLASGIGGSF